MTALNITINNHITIDGNLPLKVENYLHKRLTFINPAYIEKQEHDYWTGDTPKQLSYFERTDGGLIIPRGFTSRLLHTLSRHGGVGYTINDETRSLPEVPFKFRGQLYDFQKQAVDAVLKNRFGVITAPTGSGKTVIALDVIAERKQPALVIVHTKELMNQWKARAIQYLGLPEDEIGLIGDGKNQIGSGLTIGIVNSVYKATDLIRDHIGFLIVDECHRAPARTFIEAVTAFDSKYMLGLSATPYRRDGLTKLIYLYLGDERFKVESKELQDQNRIMKAQLIVTKTDFDFDYEDDYQRMIEALTNDNDRNTLIANTILKVSIDEGICLVISDRKSHCYTFFNLLRGKRSVQILNGDMTSKEREKVVDKLNQGAVNVLIATSQLIGEGFDLPALSHIFLATPIKFTGRVIQYIGRILRVTEGKTKATVHDFVDKPGVLKASFYTRKQAYRSLGINEKNIG
jgi:superfamily II DNA or RNA helicase